MDLELCRLIKEDPQIRHTQVILLTASGQRGDSLPHKRWGRRLSDQNRFANGIWRIACA